MRLKTFLFSLSGLFLLLWVPPKGERKREHLFLE
jgi:hypothetical protein